MASDSAKTREPSSSLFYFLHPPTVADLLPRPDYSPSSVAHGGRAIKKQPPVQMGLSTNTTPALIITLLAIMILLLNPAATDAVNETTSSKWCDGRSERCLVGEEEIESEFLMGSEISRMLADSQNFRTGSTTNSGDVVNCNRPPRYDSCLGEKRSTPPQQPCSQYNRENPC